MTQLDPKKRPSIDDAAQHFESIISNMNRFQFCLPLRSVDKPPGRFSAGIADMGATVRECWIITKGGIKRVVLFPLHLTRRGSSSVSTATGKKIIPGLRRPPPTPNN